MFNKPKTAVYGYFSTLNSEISFMRTHILKPLLFLAAFFISAQVWGQTTIYGHDFGTTTISSHPYTVTPGILDAKLSNSSWINSTGSWTSFIGSSGQAISLNNSSGTPKITLSFNVASGYELEITSFNFWTRRSSTGAQNWSMTINNIAVGSGTVPETGAAIGSTNVANAVNGLTGIVSVVISLSGASGTGTFRLDDFTLVGNISAATSCTAPTVSTLTPSTITNNSATLNADPQTYGTSATALNERGFQYSTNSGLSSPTTISQNAGGYNLDDYGIATGGALAGNTRYYYRAFVINNCTTPLTGNSHTSSYPSFVTLPNALIASTATNIDDNGFDGSWGVATGTETVTYQVQVSDDNFATTIVDQSGISGVTFTTNALLPATTYEYRVRATNSQGSGAWSNEVSFTTAAAQSEINITGNSQNIADGDITPSTIDHTDFGSVNVGSNLVRTFTIQNVNTATKNLLLSGSPVVAISGSSDFVVTTQPSSTNIAPNSSVIFQVTFTPTGSGAKTADITISNNDGDENPYNFRVGGEAVPACVAPNAVTNITLTPSGGSVSGTIDAPSGGATGYLVVRNATASLAATPTNATTYTVGNAFGTGTVAYFGTANNFTDNGLLPSTTYHYFVFPYNNTACFGGPAYNTSGYTENTTTLNLPYQAFDNFDRSDNDNVGIPSSGGSVAWTEVESGASSNRISSNALILERNGNGGTNGQEYVSFNMSGKYPTTFNTATSTLEWYFNVRQTRSNPSGFGNSSSSLYGTAYILGSTSSNVDVGNGYAVIIGNSNSSPFSTTQDGIHLVRFTNGLINANITPIITWYTSINLTNEFSIGVKYNPSNNQWELLVRNDGIFGGGFIDPTDINSSHSRGTATDSTFVGSNLQYGILYWKRASGNGEYAMFDNINIPAQQPLPEIQVEYTTNNAVNIVDGGSYNFGPILESGSNSYTAEFTITNVGTANLTLGTISVSGGNAADFSVTQPGATTLVANASTTFTVTFDPSAIGNKTTTLSFATNDTDENPFNFTLNGEGTSTPPLINEFVADIVGSNDSEFVEVFGNNIKDYSDLTLIIIEGDGANAGVIDNVFPLGTTNANGYWTTGILNNVIENGSQTYMLVKDFTGSTGQDLDVDNNGTLDNRPWNRVLDAIAYRENATADRVYSTVFFTSTFQGFSPPANVGGASRIPNGINTGSTSDWQRNEYTGFGIPGFNVATPDSREAINTPGKANTPYNVWTGAVSSAWNVAGNWTVGVPTLANELDAIIVNATNNPVFPIGGYNAFARYLVFENNSALDMQLGDLSASANVLFANNVNVSNGTLILNGTQVQTLTANNISLDVLEINNSNGVTIIEPSVINIFEKLNLKNGNLTVQNLASVTLKSTATRTAYIDDFTSGYNGTITTNNNLTIERYIPVVANPLSATPFAYLNRYFYIGSITDNITTASKWNGQFNLNANAGANNNNTVTPKTDCSREALAQGSPFSNLFRYDESRVQGDCYLKGWVPLNASATIEKGKGYAARINDPAIINSNRLLSETGNYSKLPVSFNTLSISADNNSASLYSGQFGTKGHHIIANPFWAPIDWRVIANNNASVYGTAYKFNPETGNFIPLNNSGVVPVEIGTNEAFIILPLDANQSSYNVTIPANARVNSNSNSLLRQQQPYHYKLEVKVQSADNESDKAYLIFDNNFTENHDNGFDAKKMFSAIGVPSIYTKDLNNERSSILALPENTQQTTIPLGIAIEYNGNHTLTFEGVEDFPNTSIIWLEDLQTGAIQYLRDNNTYSFTANITDNADRFLLHFAPEMLITATDANCDNENGSINITERGGLEWTYTVTDANNNPVTSNSINGSQETIGQLPSGTYTLQLTNTISGYQTTETVTVNQVATVAAAITVDNTTVNVGDIVTVDISNTTGANNTSVDMGDGTVYNNESVINHSYNVGGNYTITVNANNDNCADAASLQIMIMDTATGITNKQEQTNIKVYANQNQLYIAQHLQEGEVDMKVEVYNMLCQIVVSETINAQHKQVYVINVNDIAKGTYVARITANGKTVTKRIVIGE